MRKGLRSRYPHNWELISAQVKFDRAKNICEKCQLPNGIFIRRLKFGAIEYLNKSVIEQLIVIGRHYNITEKFTLKVNKITKVSLSVAHLNHNEMDNRPENLMCLCQSCHLQHDRVNNRMRSKIKKQIPHPPPPRNQN